MELKIISNNLTAAEAVRKGLSSDPKQLAQWLLFNPQGSELYTAVRNLPEYYITHCEKRLFDIYADAIAYNFRDESSQWDIIEFGAADGCKSKLLLDKMLRRRVKTHYYPVEMSLYYLRRLERNLAEFDTLEITGIHAPHHRVLNPLPEEAAPRLILMLGDVIGTFFPTEATVFLSGLSAQMDSRDRILVAFDMMKSPALIEKRHYDYEGLTSVFQKNVLTRINEEFRANFELKNFEYWPVYDVTNGLCGSYLVSTMKQTIEIPALDLTVHFKPWETIRTMVHQKYSEQRIYKLASAANFAVDRILYDDQKYYALVFLKRRAS